MKKGGFEIIVGKGEHTGNHHFLFILKYLQLFQSQLTSPIICYMSALLTNQKKKALENTVGRGGNAGNQHFPLFPPCFLLYQREKSSLQQHLICHLQVLSKNISFDKELSHFWFVFGNMAPSKILSFGDELISKCTSFCTVSLTLILCE